MLIKEIRELYLARTDFMEEIPTGWSVFLSMGRVNRWGRRRAQKEASSRVIRTMKT
jgi:hypothetical protein